MVCHTTSCRSRVGKRCVLGIRASDGESHVVDCLIRDGSNSTVTNHNDFEGRLDHSISVSCWINLRNRRSCVYRVGPDIANMNDSKFELVARERYPRRLRDSNSTFGIGMGVSECKVACSALGN